MKTPVLSRRHFLAGLGSLGASAVLAPSVARAFGPPSQVDVAELDLGAGTTSRPGAWKHLLFEVQGTTSVVVDAKSVVVDPSSEELFRHPFSVIVGTGAFAMPDDTAIQQLARYLSYGGFLLIDDTTGSEHGGFDDSVRQLVNVLFPTRPLSPIPSDHSIYRSFFLIDRPVGRVAMKPYMEGVTVGPAEGKGGQTPLVYCRNDLSGALERRDDGRYPYTCEPGGENQRREALKLAINTVLYCMTSDYKKDQAHVSELIREGRLDLEWAEDTDQ